jgi:hypothetical protein
MLIVWLAGHYLRLHDYSCSVMGFCSLELGDAVLPSLYLWNSRSLFPETKRNACGRVDGQAGGTVVSSWGPID